VQKIPSRQFMIGWGDSHELLVASASSQPSFKQTQKIDANR